MTGFEPSAKLRDMRERTLAFVREKIVPFENDARNGQYRVEDSLREEMVGLAEAGGLLSPHAPREYGGLGLDHREMAVIFEAAGWSPLGPLALNIQAPDEGNVNLITKVGTPAQKNRWLPGIVSGRIRTVFSMSETAG